MKTFLNRWLPPLLMMVIIFSWSTRSDLPGTGVLLIWWDFIVKKLAHLVEYGLLFYSWQRALNWGRDLELRDYRLSFVLVFLYALSDEFHQSFTPGRHAKWTDVGYDMMGGFFVYLKMKGFV